MTDADQPHDPAPAEQPAKATAASIDETVAASFPASDPPAVWTWEVAKPGAPRKADGDPPPQPPSR
jgi:hypothetical protein